VDYQDPEVLEEVNLAKELAKKAEAERDAANEKIEELNREIKRLGDRLHHEAVLMREREEKAVAVARKEGYDAGFEDYLHSDEGLEVIGRVMKAATEHALHSPLLVKPVASCIKFYQRYLKDQRDKWVTAGKPISEFSVEEEFSNAPDAPRLLCSKAQIKRANFTPEEMLAYLFQDQHDEDSEAYKDAASNAAAQSSGAPGSSQSPRASTQTPASALTTAAAGQTPADQTNQTTAAPEEPSI
jgi:hypothetical protein